MLTEWQFEMNLLHHTLVFSWISCIHDLSCALNLSQDLFMLDLKFHHALGHLNVMEHISKQWNTFSSNMSRYTSIYSQTSSLCSYRHSIQRQKSIILTGISKCDLILQVTQVLFLESLPKHISFCSLRILYNSKMTLMATLLETSAASVHCEVSLYMYLNIRRFLYFSGTTRIPRWTRWNGTTRNTGTYFFIMKKFLVYMSWTFRSYYVCRIHIVYKYMTNNVNTKKEINLLWKYWSVFSSGNLSS